MHQGHMLSLSTLPFIQCLPTDVQFFTFWAFNVSFAYFHTVEATLTKDSLACFVPDWNFRNGQAYHALVIFFLNDWA